MRYIFIEVPEAICFAVNGRTQFTIQEPELCVVQCNIVKDDSCVEIENPTAELLRLTYIRLVAIYNKALTSCKHDERSKLKLENQLQKAQLMLEELEQATKGQEEYV